MRLCDGRSLPMFVFVLLVLRLLELALRIPITVRVDGANQGRLVALAK